MECASYYVQPQGDITALYSLSPSFRTRSEDTGGAWGCVGVRERSGSAPTGTPAAKAALRGLQSA